MVNPDCEPADTSRSLRAGWRLRWLLGAARPSQPYRPPTAS